MGSDGNVFGRKKDEPSWWGGRERWVIKCCSGCFWQWEKIERLQTVVRGEGRVVVGREIKEERMRERGRKKFMGLNLE